MADQHASGYGDVARTHLARVEEYNASSLDRVAGLLLECVRHDGLVLPAGAGHSLAAVAETFYRAGGLACVRPLYHPELMPIHGAKASTAAERKHGLAADVLAEFEISPFDVFVVFSTSGANPYPVELAEAARGKGCPVVAVTSRAANAAAPRRAGSVLVDHASIVLDTLVPPGDSAYPAGEPVTAGLSSLTNMFIWNLLLVRLYDLAKAEGQDLPLWISSNVAHGDAANAALLKRYAERIPTLG